MIVKYNPKYKKSEEKISYCCNPNKNYLVYECLYSDDKLQYRLLNFLNQLMYFDKHLYDVVDDRIPPDWVFTSWDNGGVCILPKKFTTACDGNFEEHYYNARPGLEPVMAKVMQENYELEKEAYDTFLEVTEDLKKFHSDRKIKLS